MKLSKHEIEDLIERLQKGENIPDDYKYKLFPAKQKEYELVYGGKMRKEDVLANEDGVFPVPLQIEKIFNGKRKAWKDGMIKEKYNQLHIFPQIGCIYNCLYADVGLYAKKGN